MTAVTSGFCVPSNPLDSHDRCAKGDCPCVCHRIMRATTERDHVVAITSDPLAAVVGAVGWLEGALPELMEACTDPQATDLAELFVTLQEARKALQSLERDAELACAKAMLDDMAETATLRIERRRGTERKAWDHEQWKRDVRAKTLQAHGMKGAQGVITATGEVIDGAELYDVLAAVQDAHGSAAPKTTSLRALGLDARDYCESSPGAWTVRVTRMAAETKTEGSAA